MSSDLGGIVRTLVVEMTSDDMDYSTSKLEVSGELCPSEIKISVLRSEILARLGFCSISPYLQS